MTKNDTFDKVFKERIEARKAKNLLDFEGDLEKEKRKEECLCKECFYLKKGMVGMDVLTKYNCKICKKSLLSGSSIINSLCEECAKKYSLCIKCGKSLD